MIPTSILNRNPQPDDIIVIWGKDVSEYALIATSIILVLLFWIWVMYTLYNNPPSPEYLLSCNPGECATNILNGEKRCLDDQTIPILYNPGYEVCNSKFACDNTATPYALISDGSTNSTGVCEPNNACRCLTQPQCDSASVVYFSGQNDFITTFANTGNRAKYLQVSYPTQGYVGPPLILSNINTQFCSLNMNYFNAVVPRTKECSNWANALPTINEAMMCINSNPCVAGRLAFKPDDFGQFKLNLDGIGSTPVGCVPNLPISVSDPQPCTNPQQWENNPNFVGSAPVWSSNHGRILCVSQSS